MNRKKGIEETANLFVILLTLHLINIFAKYYTTKFNLSNPLIPQHLICEIFAPYALKGLILTIGLLVATALRFFKQHIIIIAICLSALVAYYLTGFTPDFTGYQD